MEGRAFALKVVTLLSLAMVSLKMFFFKVVLRCDIFSAVLLSNQKEKLSQRFLFSPSIAFSLQIFRLFFRNLFCSLPSKNSRRLPVY